MRVGLLISEFKDNKACNICLGADVAARDLGVELVIFPGKLIVTDKSYSEENAYDYQYQAVYDYIYEAGFDGLIVDINSIGKNANNILRIKTRKIRHDLTAHINPQFASVI